MISSCDQLPGELDRIDAAYRSGALTAAQAEAQLNPLRALNCDGFVAARLNYFLTEVINAQTAQTYQRTATNYKIISGVILVGAGASLLYWLFSDD